MLGINAKISNYNLSNLKLYNNNLEPIVFKYLDYKIYVVGKIFERDLIIKTKIVNCIFKSSFKNLLEFIVNKYKKLSFTDEILINKLLDIIINLFGYYLGNYLGNNIKHITTISRKISNI